MRNVGRGPGIADFRAAGRHSHIPGLKKSGATLPESPEVDTADPMSLPANDLALSATLTFGMLSVWMQALACVLMFTTMPPSSRTKAETSPEPSKAGARIGSKEQSLIFSVPLMTSVS